jgi:hypothetical protein
VSLTETEANISPFIDTREYAVILIGMRAKTPSHGVFCETDGFLYFSGCALLMGTTGRKKGEAG